MLNISYYDPIFLGCNFFFYYHLSMNLVVVHTIFFQNQTCRAAHTIFYTHQRKLKIIFEKMMCAALQV